MADIHALSALDGYLEPGRYGYAGSDRGVVTLREATPAAMVEIAAWGDAVAPLIKAVKEALRLTLVTDAHSVSNAGRHAALWLGPARWLVLSDDAILAPLQQALDDKAAVVDQSQSRVALHLSGSSVTELLSKSCSLDFHTDSFPAGRVKATLFGHLSVLIRRLGAHEFLVYLPRSFALSGLEGIMDAADEFGLIVE